MKLKAEVEAVIAEIETNIEQQQQYKDHAEFTPESLAHSRKLRKKYRRIQETIWTMQRHKNALIWVLTPSSK